MFQLTKLATLLGTGFILFGARAAETDTPQLLAQNKNATASQSFETLKKIEIQGNYLNAIGTSDAASQGSVTAQLIASRPVLRAGEILEFVPGLIVTQHSGDGKANQYFLRGFNLDHGTDFATFIDGMPVNMPSHAHGIGYSDINFMIPEVVSRIDYKKGPYYAGEGDFSSAGSARINFANTLPKGIASLTVGEGEYGRVVVVNSTVLPTGNLLYGLEAVHNNGPWDVPEHFHKLNGLLRYSFGSSDHPTTITAMAYQAKWNATDQIPQRAVDQGLIDRFGTISPTDGGDTARYSLSFATQYVQEDGVFELKAYAIQSRLNLFGDFTYFLNDPVNGDQVEQAERRRVFGFDTSQSWMGKLSGMETINKFGIQVRQDRISQLGLYDTLDRVRLNTVQEGPVRQTSAGLYFENTLQWQPWLRSIAGIRHDLMKVDVESNVPGNSGHKDASITSPKLSLILGPWKKTELFANYGESFHSNDARGVTSTVSPRSLTPIDPASLLVKTRGFEFGARTEIIPGLQSSVALWQLKLDSELVFSGDAAETEPNRPSKRTGIEWNNHYIVRPWLLVDFDLALSQAHFTEDDPVGNYVPGAVNKVASLGVTLTEFGPWFGQFQVRYFGPRPLIEDNSQRSKSTSLAYARIGYKINQDWKVSLDIFNLFNRKASDIDYYYTSRLPGESLSGVDDLHFHPVEPRTFRMTLSTQF